MSGQHIPAFPLCWPVSWKRTNSGYRTAGRFGAKSHSGTYRGIKDLSVEQAVQRVRTELERMGIDNDDLVVSTNLKLRLDGWPRSDQANPADPGVAVYWRDRHRETRCMAIDRYIRVADNIAAVAATLDAMRAIERHGGAEILDRAFTGFSALPPPAPVEAWHVVLGVQAHTSTDDVRVAYRRARGAAHPDGGGSSDAFERVQRAWETFSAERGLST